MSWQCVNRRLASVPTDVTTALSGKLSVAGTSTLTGVVTAPAGVVGNVTGNVTGNVSGAITGTSISATSVKVDVGTLAASGSNAANALANALITKTFTQVTAANNAKGIALPAMTDGQIIWVAVHNGAGCTVLVYPQTNTVINALTANSAYTTAANGAFQVVAWNSAQVYIVPVAG